MMIELQLLLLLLVHVLQNIKEESAQVNNGKNAEKG